MKRGAPHNMQKLWHMGSIGTVRVTGSRGAMRYTRGRPARKYMARAR